VIVEAPTASHPLMGVPNNCITAFDSFLSFSRQQSCLARTAAAIAVRIVLSVLEDLLGEGDSLIDLNFITTMKTPMPQWRIDPNAARQQ